MSRGRSRTRARCNITKQSRIADIDITQSSDTVFVEVVERPPKPQTEAECKNGGYKEFGFKNQGQCIKAVKATN